MNRHILCEDLENKLIVTRGKDWGEGIVREFGIDMYTLLYLKWITNKDIQCSLGNTAQCYMAAWMGGESGGKWICVSVWLSSSAVHLKLNYNNTVN